MPAATSSATTTTSSPECVLASAYKPKVSSSREPARADSRERRNIALLLCGNRRPHYTNDVSTSVELAPRRSRRFAARRFGARTKPQSHVARVRIGAILLDDFLPRG